MLEQFLECRDKLDEVFSSMQGGHADPKAGGSLWDRRGTDGWGKHPPLPQCLRHVNSPARWTNHDGNDMALGLRLDTSKAGQVCMERVDVLCKADAQSGIVVDETQGFQCGRHDWRGQCGRIDEGPRAIAQDINERPRAHDKSALAAERLA